MEFLLGVGLLMAMDQVRTTFVTARGRWVYTGWTTGAAASLLFFEPVLAFYVLLVSGVLAAAVPPPVEGYKRAFNALVMAVSSSLWWLVFTGLGGSVAALLLGAVLADLVQSAALSVVVGLDLREWVPQVGMALGSAVAGALLLAWAEWSLLAVPVAAFGVVAFLRPRYWIGVAHDDAVS